MCVAVKHALASWSCWAKGAAPLANENVNEQWQFDQNTGSHTIYMCNCRPKRQKEAKPAAQQQLSAGQARLLPPLQSAQPQQATGYEVLAHLVRQCVAQRLWDLLV